MGLELFCFPQDIRSLHVTKHLKQFKANRGSEVSLNVIKSSRQVVNSDLQGVLQKHVPLACCYERSPSRILSSPIYCSRLVHVEVDLSQCGHVKRMYFRDRPLL